jgi:hypothetical protein
MSSEPTPVSPAIESVRHDMMDAARRLVAAARADGLTLRLIGGLGIREHCRTLDVCERDYSDLDMVAPAKQSRRLATLFTRLGYAENYHVSTATANSELQFVRPCEHNAAGDGGHVHADDHIDVFLDTFRMDHDISLAKRLEIDPYTVSVSDLLLTKLQIFKLNEKDLRDVVTLLTDLEVNVDNNSRADAGAIDAAYIARLCADDWGLFYDVAMNLQRVSDRAETFGLDAVQVEHLRRGITQLIGAIDSAPKSVRWRLRARIGTRKSWHNEVDEQN